MAKLSVHLVTWNGAKYVPALFESLRKQTFQDWKLVILDNASKDEMGEAMKKEIIHFPVPVELIESKENTGFAGGHNKLFQQLPSAGSGQAEYFICLNQDLFLEPECFEKLIKFLDTHKDVAVVSPRLMKWNFSVQLPLFSGASASELPDESKSNESFTDQIDSLGLKVFRSRRVREKYSGDVWQDIKSKMHLSFRAERFRDNQTALEVFGVSGTLPCFRRSMIETITFSDNTFFDEAYHAYKEDVDLAFRLQSAGHRACVLLDAVAYHDRSAAGPESTSDTAAAQNKKSQSEWVKYHSYKNHLMTLYKNEYAQNAILDFPWILWYELKKFGYFLVFDRQVLSGLSEVWNLRKELKKKKVEIKQKRKVDFKEIRKWWK